MQNKIFRKGLVAGIIVFLMLLPPIVSSSKMSNDIIEQENAEGKPDLVITRINPSTMDAPIVNGMNCFIKNIGDSPASGTLDVRLIVRKGIFGTTIVSDNIESITLNGLAQGDKRMIKFYSSNPSSRGFYRFTGYVNIYNNIDESNSDNNYRRVFYFVLFPEDYWGWWGFG